jgi:hypothetical protein
MREMTSESCPICGEKADADELDPRGHFSTDDDDPDDTVSPHRSEPRYDGRSAQPSYVR